MFSLSVLVLLLSSLLAGLYEVGDKVDGNGEDDRGVLLRCDWAQGLQTKREREGIKKYRKKTQSMHNFLPSKEPEG